MVKENALRLTLTLFPRRYTSSCRHRRDTLILIAFGIMGRQKGTKQLIASPILGIAGIKRAQALSCVSSLFSTRFCLHQLRARSCCSLALGSQQNQLLPTVTRYHVETLELKELMKLGVEVELFEINTQSLDQLSAESKVQSVKTFP